MMTSKRAIAGAAWLYLVFATHIVCEVIRSKVLILGAGASGLAAALELHHLNISDIKIIEAQANVGGRVVHQPFGRDSVVELGANWIYGKGKNPIYKLAKRHGLKTAPSDKKNVAYFTEHGAFPRHQGDHWSHEFEKTMINMVKMADRRIEHDQVDLSSRTALQLLGWHPDAPIKAAVEYFGINWELAEPAEACSLDYAAGTVDLVSGTFPLGNDFVIDQRGFNYVLQQEAGRLVLDNAVHDPLFYFNTRVTRIEYTNGAVVVHTANGTVFEADYAICTFSLGVLQHTDVLFDPPFPDWKREALLSFHMTVYTKIFLNFEHAFWEDWQFALYASNKTRHDGDYTVWQSLTSLGYRGSARDNILMVTTTGKESTRLEEKTDAEVTREILAVLQRMYPGRHIPQPLAVLVPRWRTDPLYRGSYSNWALGASIQHHENMQAPLPAPPASNDTPSHHPRLLFAGEAYSMHWYGYLHGAWQNGQQVAKSIAQCIRTGKCPDYHYHPLVTGCYADTQRHRELVAQSRSFRDSKTYKITPQHPMQAPFSN
ncbi:hypothetical protein BC940DRAFT_291977 [Gongronella butleri]|nr:hypothetical protein BC940DRAFT_291977 [Gongronella butleri]